MVDTLAYRNRRSIYAWFTDFAVCSHIEEG